MKTFKSESDFARWFCKRLEAVNAFVIPVVGSRMQKNGVPDRYVCHRDFRGWLEFKKDKGKVTDLQRITMLRLIDRGDTCLVVRLRSPGASRPAQEQQIEIESPDGELLGRVKLNGSSSPDAVRGRGRELVTLLLGGCF